MVPSLPLWLKVPEMPKLLLRFVAWLFNRVESSRFSISPAPKTGVGMRKMMLFAAWPQQSWAAAGCRCRHRSGQ